MAEAQSSSVVVLPDSRLKNRLKGVVRGLLPILGTQINWVPVFCGNCGKPHGYVPEENCNFAFWLCTSCSEKWGDMAGAVAIMPDHIFWAKVREEQLERHGRILSPQELQVAAESPCTALGKLLREKR
jgi:hypothetical protein